MPSPSLLKLEAAAVAVGIHSMTLRRAVDRGELSAQPVPGGGLLFDRHDLAAWSEGRHGAVSPLPEAVDAAVARIVASAPPLPEAAIDTVVAALQDGLRARAEVRVA